LQKGLGLCSDRVISHQQDIHEGLATLVEISSIHGNLPRYSCQVRINMSLQEKPLPVALMLGMKNNM
jgi:hypothetical protein